MKKVKVLLDFIRPSVPVKLVKGRNVVNGLTGNPSFPTPDVELTLITDATDLLESSFAVAQNGRPEDTAKMHKNELAWEKLMRKEALYVERTADGDEAAILSSGFSISHQPAPALRPEFSLKAGKLPGTVILRRKAYPGHYCTITSVRRRF